MFKFLKKLFSRKKSISAEDLIEIKMMMAYLQNCLDDMPPEQISQLKMPSYLGIVALQKLVELTSGENLYENEIYNEEYRDFSVNTWEIIDLEYQLRNSKQDFNNLNKIRRYFDCYGDFDIDKLSSWKKPLLLNNRYESIAEAFDNQLLEVNNVDLKD
jgi:hypothetical protein